MLNGWNYERFSKDEIEEATNSPWVIDLSIDNAGFTLCVVRWEITYVRKRIREKVAS